MLLLNENQAEIVIGTPGENKTNILITVSIHGNEPCGVNAINELLQEGFFDEDKEYLKDKKIQVVLGNPLAFSRNKRFIDVNLNRFIMESLNSERDAAKYEYERSLVVQRAIKECDIHLDIHSTSAPTPPFALPANNPQSEQMCARILPVEYVVVHLAHATLEKGTAVDFALLHNKISFAVECGQHDDPKTRVHARNCIKSLICSTQNVTKPKLLKSSSSHPVLKDFKFVKPVTPFQHIKESETIATDAEGEINCPFEGGALVIMPTALPFIGEEAWFWGFPYETE